MNDRMKRKYQLIKLVRRLLRKRGLSDHDDEERSGNKFDALTEMEKYEKESI